MLLGHLIWLHFKLFFTYKTGSEELVSHVSDEPIKLTLELHNKCSICSCFATKLRTFKWTPNNPPFLYTGSQIVLAWLSVLKKLSRMFFEYWVTDLTCASMWQSFWTESCDGDHQLGRWFLAQSCWVTRCRADNGWTKCLLLTGVDRGKRRSGGDSARRW